MKGPALPPLLFFVRIPTLLAIFWRRYVSRRTIAGVSCKEPRSFLIYRLDSLSDGVLTTPFFRALKSADPKSRCTVVVQASYKSLLAANPYIDEVLALPHVKPAWLPQRLRRLLAAVLFYWTNLQSSLRFRRVAALGCGRTPGDISLCADRCSEPRWV